MSAAAIRKTRPHPLISYVPLVAAGVFVTFVAAAVKVDANVSLGRVGKVGKVANLGD